MSKVYTRGTPKPAPLDIKARRRSHHADQPHVTDAEALRRDQQQAADRLSKAIERWRALVRDG